MASSYANHTYTQARNVRFSRCLWSGGGRRAAQKYKCPVGHVLKPVARTLLSDSWWEALVPSFYIKVDKPDVNACLNSMGSDLYRLFAIPLQRTFLPCKLDIFSYSSSFACTYFIHTQGSKYPPLSVVAQCLSYMLRIQSVSRYTLTT